MCGRFVTITREELARALFDMGLGRAHMDEPHASEPQEAAQPVQSALPFELDCAPQPRADARPGATVPVAFPDTGGALQIADMSWGYTADWTLKLLFNARAEKALAAGSMWAESLAARRCIIGSRGFYEPDADKRQHLFTMPDGKLLFMAGIYADGRFSILTCEPNRWVAPVHPRMPVVLPHGELSAWFGSDYARLLDCSGIELAERAC